MDFPALEIENLRFRYDGGASPWIVDISHLELKRGEQMLLTGTSGRGKSTLLHLVAGLMEPSSGRIHVAGQDVHALVGAKRDLFRGRHLGMIFQNFNLLHGFSALENVMAAMMFSEIPRNEHRDRGLDLLRYLGIDQPNRLPEQLSIGQQQRVAVARAMACDPVLVLADEPTASLDPDNAGIAIDMIENICRDKNAALLCVSHDPSLKERFNRLASLEGLSQQSDSNAPAMAP